MCDSPGTLIEGSDTFSYILSHTSASDTFYIEADCALKGANAICTDLDSQSRTITTTIALPSIVLDVISTASPTSSGSGSGGASQSPGSSAPSSQPTSKPSSSQKMSASILGVLMSLSVAYHLV